MKQKVLKYLQENRTFGAGIQLYQSMPGHNRAIVSNLSRKGDTPTNCRHLFYEICKLANIPEVQWNKIVTAPLKIAKSVTKVDETETNVAPNATPSAASETQIPTKWADIKALVKQLGLTPNGKKKVDLVAALETHYATKKK